MSILWVTEPVELGCYGFVMMYDKIIRMIGAVRLDKQTHKEHTEVRCEGVLMYEIRFVNLPSPHPRGLFDRFRPLGILQPGNAKYPWSSYTCGSLRRLKAAVHRTFITMLERVGRAVMCQRGDRDIRDILRARRRRAQDDCMLHFHVGIQ